MDHSDAVYQNSIVTELIQAHTLERPAPAPALPPRDRGIYCVEKGPSSSEGTPSIHAYCDLIADSSPNCVTLPLQRPSRQSGPYSHVLTNHSRQISRVSQITIGRGYNAVSLPC